MKFRMPFRQIMTSRCGQAFLAATLFAAVIGLTQPASAQPFTKVIVFGDSNVDSGFYRQLPNPGGGPSFNAFWASAVAAGAGKPTTSPDLMNSEALAMYLGLTATPSNTSGGTNYATSGAKNAATNTSANGGFQQAIPTVTQIANYLASVGGVADSQALYFIHSGDNDINFAMGETGTGPFPPDKTAHMTQAATDLAAAIQSLQTAGGQKIMVAGLAYSFPGGAGNAEKRALKLHYTNTLWNQLTSLGVAHIRADIDMVRVNIRDNPAKYGFQFITTNPGEMGCTNPGVNNAWALLCAPSAPSQYVTPTAPQTHLFADSQHLGGSGQRLMANYLYDLLIPPSVTHNFDGNTTSDILWRDDGGNIAMWLMNGGGAVGSAASLGNVPNVWQIVSQQDFNGDSRADIAWRNTAGDFAIWFMNGSTIATAYSGINIPPNWSAAGTGDFNGDHFGDVLWRDETGNTAIWLLNPNDIPNVIIDAAALGNIPPSWSVVATADFDGDGKADIFWRDSSGAMALWFMFGTSVQSAASVGTVGAPWSVAGTGDFDGDGKTDLLWRDTSGNTAVWLMNGASVAGGGSLGLVASPWTVAQIGDYNADGKSDILWRNTSSGDTAIWFMNGTTVAGATSLGVVPPNWTVQNVNAD